LINCSIRARSVSLEAATAGELRQGEPTRAGDRENQPGDACADDRNDAIPRDFFPMNKFRELGFIAYNGSIEGGIEVRSSLLNAVLHDRPQIKI
jgi:hypothetical protein